ncbi:soluble guanylate cyclase 89Db-like [Homarus americanus]|uniref:soluble guanylate cyclase 89Db-like n=1 Tax=Homarus americanus TaxID=6706 RepID=UPI001C475EEA|nr:soluble guanylate cyclase 89Db-like [Homarus americanus]
MEVRKPQGFNRPTLPSFSVGKQFLLFPFGIVLDPDLKVRFAGERILHLLGKELLGSEFVEYFSIQRPHVTLSWDSITKLQNVTWEVVSKKLPLRDTHPGNVGTGSTPGSAGAGTKATSLVSVRDNPIRRGSSQAPWASQESSLQSIRGLLLKGQMYIIKDSNVALFLCMPL